MDYNANKSFHVIVNGVFHHLDFPAHTLKSNPERVECE
jgi:hypothetical protein